MKRPFYYLLSLSVLLLAGCNKEDVKIEKHQPTKLAAPANVQVDPDGITSTSVRLTWDPVMSDELGGVHGFLLSGRDFRNH